MTTLAPIRSNPLVVSSGGHGAIAVHRYFPLFPSKPYDPALLTELRRRGAGLGRVEP